ncbi:site-specific integrase [Streptomyces sp. NPDC023838]|uniref:tyrosine-type recombinase/integrase n=1 Tax=Streptomyces sp. NPDC023838 TaxID=3154325 RepID=UPI0033CB71D8
MATIRKRERKDGSFTYQVRWLQGGRGGTWESENFAEEMPAEQFKLLVVAHGERWPHGWVRGQGFVEAAAVPGDMPFTAWAERYINRLTGIEDRTRDDYLSEVRLHLSRIRHTELNGHVGPATICNITADDVQDWIRAEETGQPHPTEADKWIRKPASPKSISNRHGLMFSIVQAAVDATPQLRTVNCCTKTRLPRVDSHTEEEMTFLERDEYQRLAQEIVDPAARDLADWLVGTGMRWGEATALQVRDLSLGSSTPTASVQRAWKRAKKGSTDPLKLGPPKSRKSRRRVALSPAQVTMARRLIAGKGPDAYVFLTPSGKYWRHSNFHERCWAPAVRAAVQKGLTKRPRIHDLRHTHVAWLIERNVPLPAIQGRLGHESITTTVDRYGHLVRSLDAEITAVVQNAMSVDRPPATPALKRVV